MGRTPWSTSLRGRIGWGTYNTLLYFTGGVAFGRIEQSSVGSATKVGVALGVGVEANMRPNTRGRIEYRYTNIGTVPGSTNPALGQSSDILAGVSFRFR